MPDHIIIEKCEYFIRKHLDNLNDLNYEFANTVSNVYYKNFKNRDDIENLKTLRGVDEIELINRMISSYRKIKEKECAKDYNYISGLIIDEMKYGIKKAHTKSQVRRWIERVLKKKKIDEVQGLIDLMDVWSSK